MSFIIEDKFIEEFKLKGNELLIYAVIYSYSKGINGCCWCSRKTLKNYIGASSLRTVDNVLELLQNKKLIRKAYVTVDGVKVPSYMVVDNTSKLVREKYEKYILQEFSNVTRDLFFKDAKFTYLGDAVTLTLKKVCGKEICEDWRKLIERQNEFYNMQHKTGLYINIVYEA